MSLDNIAKQIGTITDEQTDDTDTRVMTDDHTIPKRNLNEYDGAYDPEGRADRDKYASRDDAEGTTIDIPTDDE